MKIAEWLKTYIDTKATEGGRHGSQNAFFSTEILKALNKAGLGDYDFSENERPELIKEKIMGVALRFRQKYGYDRARAAAEYPDSDLKNELHEFIFNHTTPLIKFAGKSCGFFHAAAGGAAIEPLKIKDPEGDNYATSVEKLSDGSYKIHGTNKDGDPRAVTVQADGSVSGRNGPGKPLGVVETQLYTLRKSILEHFNVSTEPSAAKGPS